MSGETSFARIELNRMDDHWKISLHSKEDDIYIRTFGPVGRDFLYSLEYGSGDFLISLHEMFRVRVYKNYTQITYIYERRTRSIRVVYITEVDRLRLIQKLKEDHR